MKRFKRVLRVCYLVLFMILAATGIGILGVAPTKDKKLFADIELRIVDEKTKNADIPSEHPFKF